MNPRILLASLALVLLMAASALAAFYSPRAFLPALCVYALIMFVATNWKGLTQIFLGENMSRNQAAQADDRADATQG
jgi:Na+/H+ antiporter NhaB